jgi:hypothetical protein
MKERESRGGHLVKNKAEEQHNQSQTFSRFRIRLWFRINQSPHQHFLPLRERLPAADTELDDIPSEISSEEGRLRRLLVGSGIDSWVNSKLRLIILEDWKSIVIVWRLKVDLRFSVFGGWGRNVSLILMNWKRWRVNWKRFNVSPFSLNMRIRISWMQMLLCYLVFFL